MLTIVAYATAGAYEIEAQRLRDSVEALGLSFFLGILPAAPDWLTAVRLKPQFLIGARAMFAGSALLYVDADAVLHSDPAAWLPADDGSWDIGLHNWQGGVEGYVTGTIYLPARGPCGGVTDLLLQSWCRRDHLRPHPRQPQRVLRALLLDTDDYNVVDLAPELCWIFDISPEVYGSAHIMVIEHLQASRELRFPGHYNERAASRRARLAELGAAP